MDAAQSSSGGRHREQQPAAGHPLTSSHPGVSTAAAHHPAARESALVTEERHALAVGLAVDV
jgi:hypothetical protein